MAFETRGDKAIAAELDRMRREVATLKAALIHIAAAQDVPQWAREAACIAAFCETKEAIDSDAGYIVRRGDD